MGSIFADFADCTQQLTSIEGWSGLTTFPAVFVPVQVVAAFGMVFIPASDQDVIPDYPAVAFDSRRESPSVADLDHFDNVDAICIRFCSSHGVFPPWGEQVS